MLAVLGPDVATVLVALILFSICLGIIGRAAVRHHRQKERGGLGCGCGCVGCTGCAGCSGCAGAHPPK